MGRMMNRSKQQILLRFLPGKTFDFERVAAIARVENIRGVLKGDLNLAIVVNRISEEARDWQSEYRQSLSDNVLTDPSRFVLLEPREVRAELFPKALWCQNRACGRIFNCESWDNLPIRCQSCRNGSLRQLRFVKVHRCGEIKPLLPPNCNRCQTAQHMALDTRGSERISNFRWLCRNRGCSYSTSVFAGFCTNCQWPNADPQNKLQQMQVEVHRAGSTYYPHTTVLLNLPNRAFEAFLNVPEWQCVAAAKFLGMTDKRLSEFTPASSSDSSLQTGGVSAEELDRLMQQVVSGEITPEQYIQQTQALSQQRRSQQQQSSSSVLATELVGRTGVSRATWESAGQEMLEAIMPLESGSPADLEENANDPDYQTAANVARRMGLRIKRLDDFPMLTATYGYSRVSYEPNQCYIKPFPPEREHNGKYPIYVDQVQADALLVSLDPERVWRWLERNGYSSILPAGTDEQLARRAWFVQLLTDVSVRETITADAPEARMVFGLLHTLSHLCVRQASLLCGLDTTSLSEYILPRALTLAVYSNHRSGATIGALTALFEQTLAEWLNSIRASRRCVYDPVCYEREGNCHACTHLAETSCRFFNLNLSRAFLFGGIDKHLGRIETGYFDPSL